jgi:hypothetical protein
VDGVQVQNETELTLVNGAIYGLNFDLPNGDYLIRLCDGTTREVHRAEGDKGVILGLMFLPLLLAALLLWAGSQINDELILPKIFTYLFIIPAFWASTRIGLQAIIDFYPGSALELAASDTLAKFTYVFMLLFLLVFLYVIKYGMDQMKAQKLRAREY